MIDTAPNEPIPPFGAEAMATLFREHRERGAAVYAGAISKLWLGNGAGAVGAVSAMGAASGRLALHKWFLLCPGAFVAGLILLGVGTLATLVDESKWLTAHEETQGLLDLRVGLIPRPKDEIWLSLP